MPKAQQRIATHALRRQGLTRHDQAEGGPGSGPRKGGSSDKKDIPDSEPQGSGDKKEPTPVAKKSQKTFVGRLKRGGKKRPFGWADSEGGPGSGPGGGRSKFAPEQPETPEDMQIGQFTRREKPSQRRARIKRKKVDPATSKAIQRAFLVVRATVASEGIMGDMGEPFENPQPDHQQYDSPGLSHGRRGGD